MTIAKEESAPQMGREWRTAIGYWALRPVAPDAWDGLLWASGAVSLAGILLSVFVPDVSELAVLFSLTLLVGGPWGLFLPLAYEPILMIFARLQPLVLVALVATVGATMVEYANYRIYQGALHSGRLRGVRESGIAKRVVRWFQVQSFVTVALCALTPVPFWIVRVAAALRRYSVRRFLIAHTVGRFPRFLFYGAVGTVLPLSTGQLVTIGVIASVTVVIVIAMRARWAAAPQRQEP